MALSRAFKVSLLISMAIHAGAFSLLGRDVISEKILAPPKPLAAKKIKQSAVRFELVDTPESAKSDEPPTKSTLYSDKNTRAQDRFEGKKKAQDSPHMVGKHEDSKDTRQKTIVSKPAPIPKPPKPAQKLKEEPTKKEIAKERQRRLRAERAEEEKKRNLIPPDKEAGKSVKDAWIESEPKRKEVVRLAKKEPAPVAPAQAPEAGISARMISPAGAKNAEADARISGELSFGATRHFFGEYLLKMKQAVETEWISLLISEYTAIERSSAVIDFKIQADGSVSDMEINSNEGDPYFPLVCRSSIRDAQPFDEIQYDEIPGLPDEFADKPLSIRFTFNYN